MPMQIVAPVRRLSASSNPSASKGSGKKKSFDTSVLTEMEESAAVLQHQRRGFLVHFLIHFYIIHVIHVLCTMGQFEK